MQDRFIEIESTDDVLDDVLNAKLVVPGNKLIGEHNEHTADADIHVTLEKQEEWNQNTEKIDTLIQVSASPPTATFPNGYWYKVI